MATTIVERDSSSPAGALLIFLLFAILIVGGIWFAYTNGLVGRSEVIENHKTVIVQPSAPQAPAAPAPAH